MQTNKSLYAIAATRIALGFIFLWSFFDKTFGLGFSTASGKAWLDGVSPTGYYLSKMTAGPLAGFYHSIAGSPVVDWLFMLGLLGIGLSLFLGILIRWGAIAGTVLTILLGLTVFPPTNNPLIDNHAVYALFLIAVSLSAEHKLSLQNIFKKSNAS